MSAAPTTTAPQERPVPPRAPHVHRSPLARLWYRQLDRYPDNAARWLYLGIVVVASIALYHQLYVQFSVATKIMADYHMSFTFFLYISVVGNAVGALASVIAGLADRWGRANLVVYGLAVTALLVLVGLPNAPDKETYLALYAALCFVEGMLLVATPALMRDFSPQLGRASAMGFWTLGPVIGSVIVTEISSNTLAHHPQWQTQFYYAGIMGLGVFALALFGLRELSPALRDQLMVTLRDKALIEARAQGLDVEALSRHPWRQMMHLDIFGSAFAISVFLVIYYTTVGYFVVYMATTFGYSEARANALASWFWISEAIALVGIGLLSDRVRVRKPFMLIGALGSIVMGAIFATRATHPDTTYYTFAVIILFLAVFQGVAYSPWMASFTETVEKRNPAATATGLAVFGLTIRIIVAASTAMIPLVVHSVTPLVDNGPRVAAIAAAHPKAVAVLASIDPATSRALARDALDPSALPTALGEVARQQGASPAIAQQVRTSAAAHLTELATASAINPQTLATLTKDPTNAAAIARATRDIATRFGIDQAAALSRLSALATPQVQAALTLVTPYAAALQNANAAIPAADLAYLQAHGTTVSKAQNSVAAEWRRWWLITVACQLVFLPFIFVMAGHWSPAKARRDEQEHERRVAQELAKIQTDLR